MNNILQPNGNMMGPFNGAMTGQFGVRPITNYLTNKIIVNNIEEVKQYPAPFGGDYIFLHSTEPILFRKVVDNYGQYQVTEFNINQREPVENIVNNQYVSASDFNALKSDFEALKNKMEVANESIKQQQSN